MLSFHLGSRQCRQEVLPSENSGGRTFQFHWIKQHEWVSYDEDKGRVHCSICVQAISVQCLFQRPRHKWLSPAVINEILEDFAHATLRVICIWDKDLNTTV